MSYPLLQRSYYTKFICWMIDDWEVDGGHIADENISFKEIF